MRFLYANYQSRREHRALTTHFCGNTSVTSTASLFRFWPARVSNLWLQMVIPKNFIAQILGCSSKAPFWHGPNMNLPVLVFRWLFSYNMPLNIRHLGGCPLEFQEPHESKSQRIEGLLYVLFAIIHIDLGMHSHLISIRMMKYFIPANQT